jgi:hypothetical protein
LNHKILNYLLHDVLSPEVGFEVNFFRWLRISAGAGYRFVNGLDNTMNIRNDDISGPTGTLTFKIGGFGRRYSTQLKIGQR